MFKIITPEKAGISSKYVLKFIKALDKNNLCTHSFIMAKGDSIFAEGYYAPFHKGFKHRMYSISKSFVCIAVGLAIEDGLLSLDDKMVNFFPEYLKEDTDKLLLDMTIRDMLTMQTCVVSHKKWFYQNYKDRIEAYFKAEIIKKPGTSWNYDSPASFMLCCIVEKLTGKPFLDYLKERFLIKAGFSLDSYCLKCPGNHSFGDSGIVCTARDLLVFARFIMNGGKINGVSYINEEFIKEATKKQVSNSHGGEYSNGSYGYGYQIWKTRNDGFAFVGMGDQIVICDPKKDFVFIINSDNQGMGDFSRTIIYHELYETIINNLNESQEEDNEAFNELNEYLSNLKLFSLNDNINSSLIEKINGRIYKLNNNPMKIEWIRLDFIEDKGTLAYKNMQGEKSISFGFGFNVFQKFPQTGYSNMIASLPSEDNMYDCAVSADWPEHNKLRIKVQIIDNYIGNLNIELGFKDNEVGVSMIKNAEAFLDEYQGYAIGYDV